MLRMAAVFSSSMVLQRNKNIAVWGESDGDFVEVSLNGCTVGTNVHDGRWSLCLPPFEAGGPYSMSVTNGSDVTSFDDIMIGEVWLAGGQSNMELELKDCRDGSRIVQGAADNSTGCNVRFYYTPKVAWMGEELYKAESGSSWEKFTTGNCSRWSAVGYHFASKLSEKLGVTVGIIGCNWGGTSASCWMSREFLGQQLCLSSYLEEYDSIVSKQDEAEYLKEWEEYLVYQAEFDKNVGNYYATSPNPTWDEAIRLFGENKYPGPVGPRNEHRPCGLYETMVSRIAPYTLAGFLYYQGEEDDHKPYTYYELLSTLVKQWRHDWKDDTLPFMLVQLPIFQGEGEPDYQNWPFIREAQMKLYNTVKNTGIAVILEYGEYGNIHPVDKEPVGERLVLQAMYHVYGGTDAASAFGPVYKSHFTDGSKMYIQFQNSEAGIVCKADSEEGFEIAGDDKKYYHAKAEIEGSAVVLKSDKVQKPLYARYCWTNYRKVTLFGANGIPVAPFRTSTEDGSKAVGSRNGLAQ